MFRLSPFLVERSLFLPKVMSGRNRFLFTASQWQELEHQALIFKYMASGIPIPPDLLVTIKRSCLDSPLSSKFFAHHPQHSMPTRLCVCVSMCVCGWVGGWVGVCVCVLIYFRFEFLNEVYDFGDKGDLRCLWMQLAGTTCRWVWEGK